jgi:hypothetical protein
MSKAGCTLCGDVMESKHVHHFVRCKCGESFLDGGDVYMRGTMTTLPLNTEDGMTEEEFLAHLDKLDKEIDMGKKDPTPTDKVYSLEEVEEMTLTQFREGQRNGMYQCHDTVNNTIRRLRQSLEDVWAIEFSGAITDTKRAQVDKMLFALDTLTTLDDMFQGAYDDKLFAINAEDEDWGEGHGEVRL